MYILESILHECHLVFDYSMQNKNPLEKGNIVMCIIEAIELIRSLENRDTYFFLSDESQSRVFRTLRTRQF